MYPGRIAQAHPAGDLLKQYGTHGCPVDIVEDWTIEELDEAVAYGAHPTAKEETAATALRQEALEKVEQGFVKLVKWTDLRQHIINGKQTHVKISPIAAIPHKSRLFRMILDLSNKGQRKKGLTQTKSVNELTNEAAAPAESMNQLGKALGRVIFTLGSQPMEAGPILMCKLDIKDGFWRMCVPETQQEQFCYVLPQLPGTPPEDIQLVVPAALQMGWTSSPAFFCAATETGRDVAEWLRLLPRLPPHPLEKHLMDPINPTLLHPHHNSSTDSQPEPHPSVNPQEEAMDNPQESPATPPNPPQECPTFTPTPPLASNPQDAAEPPIPISHLCENPTFREKFFHLFEVYVDDYIALIQSTDPEVLRHHSRALLHAIHQIFPPPEATGHDGENPISLKKLILEGEGIWDTTKEILGWVFDGFERTMQLPQSKVEKLRATINDIIDKGYCKLKDFESLLGKCAHACQGIPGGPAILPPLNQALHSAKRANKHFVKIHKKSAQWHALFDLRTIIKLLGKEPIHCAQLIPGLPSYIGHTDACKFGAGGIWLAGRKNLRPIVWRLKWPQDIVDLVTAGKLTINDLEMAAIVLHYLLLEQLVPLKHLHTAVWCDNTSAVSWTYKMNSKRSLIGQQLTRVLTLRMLSNKSSPLAPISIAGKDNDLADLASRSFKRTGVQGNYDLTDSQFLQFFNESFPLTQGASWLMLRLHDRITSRVFTLLRGETVPAGSWLRLPESAVDIGSIGKHSVDKTITWTSFSKELMTKEELTSSAPLPATSVKGMQEEDIKSGLAQFRMRWAPSARPSQWNASQTPSTPQVPKNTGGT